MPINIKFLNLKNVFLNAENLLLFKISIVETIKSRATSSLKSKMYLNLSAIIKNIIKKGTQKML